MPPTIDSQTIPETAIQPEDAWLFGWDDTPGIVSVWAERSGQALVWQRLAGRVVCSTARFRPWLYATTLADLAHLGSTLAPVENPLDLDLNGKQPFSYRELAGAPRSFRYLLSADDGRNLEREILKGAKRRLGKEIANLNELGDDYYRVGPNEQYLMATGRVFFRGLAYADLHRLQFDLETTSFSPKHGRIFMVAVHDSRGLAKVFEAPTAKDEARLIRDLCELIQARDPDVIENHNLFGFDLPFLEERAKVLGIPLEIGRKEGPHRLESYKEPLAFRRARRTRFTLAGRELIDTLDAVLRHDFSARDMPGHGLKAAARYFGVAAPERTYLEGSKIYSTYRTDPETVRRYAFDDVLEVDGLSQRLMGAAFALAGMAPRPYGRVASAGPAMGILEPMLIRAYLRAGTALPPYPVSERAELGPHAGGATYLYQGGAARQVVKADIASMYPSIMRTFKVGPKSDRLGVLLYLVSRLTDLRLEHKAAARTTPPSSPENFHHQAVQAAMKIIINSGYGYLGAGSMALFSDLRAANEVTARGRAILEGVVNTLREDGMGLLEADTDGVFFAAPGGWTEAQERAYVAKVAATLPEGLRLEYEGRYQAMLNHEVKNYALLTYDDKLIVRGVAFRSVRAEQFGVEFLQKAVYCALTGDIEGLRAVYQETLTALRERRYPNFEMTTLARLAKTPEQYFNSSSRMREAPYEALIAAGRREWRVGERIRFYRNKDGQPIYLKESDFEEEDQSTEGEEDGETFEEVQEITSLEMVSPHLNPRPPAAKSDYDVDYYVKVLHTSFVSRLRKAFSGEDYEQIFRPGAQLGLFDKPLEQVQPLWIEAAG
ncbi:MAG: ribonuclease H-like domain-containing protein [Chloroflexi bacterium]|nr:ribonuclease H-like domain-containing protein [Chloroflexota bacterium]OJW02714.1 MAG: DNA polymerase [Chloroflexi bacterium 54-19]